MPFKNMQVTWKHILSFLLCLAIGIAVGFGLKGCTTDPIPEPQPIHDTIVRVDTMIEYKTRVKYITHTDTSIIFKTDTILVEIPVEHKEYADSIVTDSSRIAWNVQYSGYKAKIDTFALDYTIQPQVRTIENNRGWRQFIGVGIGAGQGVTFVEKQPHFAPYIGLHVFYGFGWTWNRKKK